MDDESPRKRTSASRDSLDILRRVEPVLLRLASDIISLRQGTLTLVGAPAGGHSGGGPEGGGKEIAESAQRLARGLDELSETQHQVRRLLELINEEQRRLAQSQARQMDGNDQLLAGHSTLIDGVEQLHEETSSHHIETGIAHDAQAVQLQGMRLAVLRLTEEQEGAADSLREQAERIARLEERVRRQSESVSAFRRELRSMPMLMTLAALVFALVGAAVMVLKVRLS